MELESTNSGPTAKLPILKLGEYEMWAIRIKQYFQIQDYALWEVIKNKEKTKKKNDVKARGLLLMALPNEHQLTFSQYPDAKSMFAAIETRFGGNAATKKTLLKQQYENFSATSAESLDSIFNRLQKIVSRLAILGVIIAQEDLNLKFLSSLPPEWNTHVVVWMNKPEIEGFGAFMTAPSSSSTNDANTASSQVSAASPSVNNASPQVFTTNVSDNTVYAFMVENLNGYNVLHQDLEQIHKDDLEAIDLVGALFAKCESKEVECYNYHNLGHFARECRASRSKEAQFKNQDNTRKQGNKEDSSKAMLAIDGVTICDMLSKTGVCGYSAVPPPPPLNLQIDLTNIDCLFLGLDEFKEPEFKGYGPENNDEEQDESKTKPEKKTVIPTATKIEKQEKFNIPSNEKGVNIVRPRIVNTARSYRTPVNTVRPRVINTVRQNRTLVNAARANRFNVVKPTACWVWRPIKPNSASITLNKYNYIDARGRSNGCSRHMTGNIAYLSDFKQFDGGYVAFGGEVMGTKVATIFQFLSIEALFKGRHITRGGTPRYLSLVSPSVKVGVGLSIRRLGDRWNRGYLPYCSSLEAE
ncbi:hypothetical protein Tco_1525228 [Tanacetum coccineum]